ncbi:Os03g0825850 [Oryza sativa Japonica Group]|uniref:Os03g0825850 protein n=2 Tax=Oryza sativa subsp. japonica TaxID=39947 RepID=C7IZK1_ORYSJ|nr:hypothetical protein EE612_021404 [Oryza sativa]BAH92421.1 Os03g0825850 [Oryza sativa Japonica Group]BAS87152.1 Os03g0825850 [Oryza sativa Japonica Group]|eukprot:NP_001173693.1 Os03g0825850 [Oryza sativa Japonica Group]
MLNYLNPIGAPVLSRRRGDGGGGGGRVLPAVVFPPDRPQRLRAPPHRRPLLPRRRDALLGELHHLLHRRHRRRAPPDPGVHGHHHLPSPEPLQRLQSHRIAVAAALDGRAAGDELDEEDAEGVDVALVGELVRAQVLRVHVPGGALPLRVLRLRALAAGHPRQPDAGQLRRQRVRQEHVR